MIGALILLFIVLPIAELYVIIKVGEAIGILPTLALLVLDSFLGVALVRSQGRAVWARFNRALAAGRMPAREIFDGAMVILGGALLLTPGFITDVAGFLLLLPPTRALFRAAVARMARRRVAFTFRAYATRGWGPQGGGNGYSRGFDPRDFDIEGTAREVSDPAELERGDDE